MVGLFLCSLVVLGECYCWVSTSVYEKLRDLPEGSSPTGDDQELLAAYNYCNRPYHDLAKIENEFSLDEAASSNGVQIFVAPSDTTRVVPCDVLTVPCGTLIMPLTVEVYAPSLNEGTPNTQAVVFESSYTEVPICAPFGGNGFNTQAQFPDLRVSVQGPVTVRNSKSSEENNVHKLFTMSFSLSSDLLTFETPEGSSIEIYIDNGAIIDEQWSTIMQDPKVQLASWRYDFRYLETSFDAASLPLVERVQQYYSNSQLVQQEITTYRTVSIDAGARNLVTYGNGKVTLSSDDSDGVPCVFTVSSKDTYLKVHGNDILTVTCESGASVDQIPWGEVFANNEVVISGDWPVVDDIVTVQSNRGYVKHETIEGVSYTWESVPPYMSVSGVPTVTLKSATVPFDFNEFVSVFKLSESETWIPGQFWGCYTFNLTYPESTLHIGIFRSLVWQNDRFEINGGELEIVLDHCDRDNPDVQYSCMNVDLRSYKPRHGFGLRDGGKILALYRVANSFDSLENVWEKYEQSQEKHEWTSFEGEEISKALWNDWKYILDFSRTNVADLTTAVKQDLSNAFSTLENLSYSGKAEMEVWRMDAPISVLYSTEILPIVCLKRGEKLNLDDWTIKWNPSIFYADGDRSMYYPPMSDFSTSGSFQKITKDGCDCIAYKIDRVPNSAFNIVVYASNQSLVDVLSGYSQLIVFVSPSTIDNEVTLSNPKAKNTILVCLDDVPDDKSIDLWSMRTDGNLIVLGVPTGPIYDGRVFKALEDCMNLAETDWSSIYEIVEPLISGYKDLLPRVSLKIHSLDSIVMFAVNYVGSSIECDLLVAGACEFSSIQDTEIKASYVVTDTSTYDSLKSKSLNNLVLVPVSISPPDYLSVSSIEFDVGKWRLVSSGYTNSIKNQENVRYEIDTSKVSQLFVVSHTDSIVFAIPQGSTVTSVKGVSMIMNLGTDNMYTALPATPLLSVEDKKDHDPMFHRLAPLLSLGAKLFATKATGKSATFAGSWDQVTDIQGSFSVDSGSDPIEVKEVPTNVVASLQVKSSQESTVSLPEGVTNVNIDMPLQVISGNQKMSYGSGIGSVKFNNLTFNGGRASSPLASSLTLTINDVQQNLNVANIKCCDYSDVNLDHLSLSNSLEMGIGSKLKAPGAQYGQSLAVSLHYTIKSLFSDATQSDPGLTDIPKLTLIYDNDEISFDMKPYDQKSALVYKFSTPEQCQKCLTATTFQAENPNFQGESNAVKATCEEANLRLTLMRVPEPTPTPELPSKPEEEEESEPSKSNVGAIVGGVIGALAVVAIVVGVVLFVLHRRKQKLMRNSSSSFSNETASTTAE